MVGALAACNYTVGECYPRAQDDGSGDTGVIISSGAGGFGDAPPKQPQDTASPPPDCNIVAGSPCEEKCLADYTGEAATCGKVEIETQRRTCQEGAYEHYKSCRGACQQQDDCRKRCEEQAEACEAECRKLPIDDKVGRQKCWAACNSAYAACVKKCK